MDLGLQGKKALVTGATRGIGRAIVELLASEGVDIALCSRKQNEVDEAVASLSAKGVKVTGAVVDVADGDAYSSWISAAADELGGLDIFVPNVSAGGGMEGEKSWTNAFNVDVLGAVRGVEAVSPFLSKSDAGAIVFIGTTAAIENFMAPQAYNAMKAGLINYAKHLSQQLASKGIRVNTVSPGPVLIEGGAWDMIQKGMPAIYDSTVAQMPIGRMGAAQEIANAVAFLASPAASFIMGTNIIADGGLTKGVQY